MVSVLVSVADSYATKSLPLKRFGMEAEVGIEPTNAAFAEPCLTTWLPRHRDDKVNFVSHPNQVKFRIGQLFYLEGLRWPKGVECQRCKSKEIARVKERDQFNCNACQYQFTHYPCFGILDAPILIQ